MTLEADNAKIYEESLAQHGDSYQSLNWGSRAGQVRRFQVLADVGPLNNTKILDVGCGLAHFLDWLNEQKIEAEYFGFDVTENLLQRARIRYPRHRFMQGSIMSAEGLADESYDYVFASGVFTYFASVGDIAVETAIGNMWKAATKGIAFNCLSSWAPDQSADEYYADPSFLLDVCRRLSPWVVLRHDYHPRDLTVYVTREPRR